LGAENVPPARVASVAEEARLDQPVHERGDGTAMAAINTPM
jgi:hypothetical protein